MPARATTPAQPLRGAGGRHRRRAPGTGTPVDRLLGYRWDGKRFVPDPVPGRRAVHPLPRQHRLRLRRYSGEDQHTTYAYDREGFRCTRDDPGNPCLAQPASPPARRTRCRASTTTTSSRSWPPTPAPGARAHRAAARASRRARRSRSRDPLNPTRGAAYVYVMRAGGETAPARRLRRGQRLRPLRARRRTPTASSCPSPATTTTATPPQGIYCDAEGNVVLNADGTAEDRARRPRDYARRSRPTRYRFRYDGRWLMTQIEHLARRRRSVRPGPGRPLEGARVRAGPRLGDACCGYEEEDTNWGGSSTLLGERSRPGAHDPRDLGRRLRHERDPPRDLLPRRDAAEDLAARARDPAARRHLRPVGLQRRPRDRFYNSQQARRACRSTAATTRCSATSTTPATTTTTRTTRASSTRATASSTSQLELCQLALPPERRPGRPDVRRGQRGARLERRSPGPAARSSTASPRRRTRRSRRAARAQSRARGALLPRRLAASTTAPGSDPGPKLNLRSGDEPRTASDGRAAQCWRAADGVPGRQRPLLPGLDRHPRRAHPLPRRLRQRAPDGADDRDRQRLADGHAARPPRRDAGEAYGRGMESPLVAAAVPVDLPGD